MRQEMLYARNTPAVDGAQWTGIVTQVAINMLESGAVDAVVCVQSAEDDRFAPKPVRMALFVVCASACSGLWSLFGRGRAACRHMLLAASPLYIAKYYSSLDIL